MDTSADKATYQPFVPADPELQGRRDADYAWARDNTDLQKHYCGLVVAVHNKQVWGAGRDHGVALRRARRKPGAPDRSEFAFVYVHYYFAKDDPAYQWAREDVQIQRRYGGHLCAISGRQIWGDGYTLPEAWGRAKKKPGCPPREELEFVVIPWVLDEPDTDEIPPA